jgi:hypothetical protein
VLAKYAMAATDVVAIRPNVLQVLAQKGRKAVEYLEIQ